jgi:hypothetical protein
MCCWTESLHQAVLMHISPCTSEGCMRGCSRVADLRLVPHKQACGGHGMVFTVQCCNNGQSNGHSVTPGRWGSKVRVHACRWTCWNGGGWMLCVMYLCDVFV